MDSQLPNVLPDSFLPGGLPLHGTFARFKGALFACRIGEFQGNGRAPDDVTLSTRGTVSPGPDWVYGPHPFTPADSEWTLVVRQRETDETFRCIADATWQGLKLGGLSYLPEARLIGGYLSQGSHPALNSLRGLVRVDVSTWHGYIPFDEMERLEIQRTPIPDKSAHAKPSSWWLPSGLHRN